MHDDDPLRPEAPTPDEPPTTPGAIERLLLGAEAAAEAAVNVAANTVRELPGRRVRRIRRLGRVPLPSLSELYPESRQARPVVIGLRSIPVEAIRGTAVGGGDQRGGDFLPLKPFRGANWSARWQRLRKAQDSLKILPPIDVVRFADSYWVIDGHNRVALGLYANQGDIDASVTELVPPGGRRTEPIVTLEAEVEAARTVRALTQTEPHIDPPVDPPLDRPDDPA